jgi:hypothetical protein
LRSSHPLWQQHMTAHFLCWPTTGGLTSDRHVDYLSWFTICLQCWSLLQIVSGCYACPSLAKAKPGDRFQFERLG